MATVIPATIAALQVKARRKDHHRTFPVVILAFDECKPSFHLFATLPSTKSIPLPSETEAGSGARRSSRRAETAFVVVAI